ncbi:hypothetical protein GTY86_29055 [Streptomyces sp. SID5770]|uniref:hypothetical protein n=1 Tax=unclassified Streptomyces TaxID=2593676 RepID=UPI00136C111C|nr:hypothetical protein [Streptomyces sp. SID5770]MZE55253.1 hypothetical protein [Streptomyces sp. SID5770]
MILTTTSRTARRSRLAVLVLLPVLALTAACGDAGGVREGDAVASVPETPAPSGATAGSSASAAPPAGKSAFYDAQLKYVRCMRAKGGYEDYPDPKLSGHLDWDRIGAIASRPGQQEAYKGGKDGVCVPELRAVMAVEPRRDQQRDYESMLAHAACMRDNGVSRFTNPTMSDGNAQPGGDPNPASPVIDQDSPAYKKARETCRTKLLDGLDGLQ